MWRRGSGLRPSPHGDTAATSAQSVADPEITALIGKTRAVDNHSHANSVAPGDSDQSALPLEVISPFEVPVQLRPDNPDWLAAYLELGNVVGGHRRSASRRVRPKKSEMERLGFRGRCLVRAPPVQARGRGAARPMRRSFACARTAKRALALRDGAIHPPPRPCCPVSPHSCRRGHNHAFQRTAGADDGGPCEQFLGAGRR